MKRTIISYKKLDQHKVEIIGFKNAASRDEIEAELGHQGAKEYLNDGLSYYIEPYSMNTMRGWIGGIVIKRDNEKKWLGHIGTILPGMVIPMVRLKIWTGKMKEAGNRFTELKAQYQKVYEVKI